LFWRTVGRGAFADGVSGGKPQQSASEDGRYKGNWRRRLAATVLVEYSAGLFYYL